MYAVLYKNFEFLKPFDRLYGSKFNDSEGIVKCFGINNASSEELNENIEVLFFNSNSDFAVFTNIPGMTKPMVLTWVRNIDRWFLRELYPEDTFFSDDGYASDELPDDIITHCEPLIDFINKIKTIG